MECRRRNVYCVTMRFWVSVSAVVCAFLLFACDGPTVGSKLYSRSGAIQVQSLFELERSVQFISHAVQAPIRDTMQDLDDLPMYLLSNDEVMIFVRHNASEEYCDWSKSCEWEYSLTSTNISLDQSAQQKVVDRSFAALSQLKL